MSEFLSNPDYLPHIQSGLPTDCCVYRPWKSVSINLQSLRTFTAYCQHPTMYHHIEGTKRITTLQLFRFCLAGICWCVLKTTVALFYSDPMMAYCGTEWVICINVETGCF